MIKTTETVKHLIIINVLFFVAALVFKEPFYDIFAMHFIKSDLFKPWQIITHMFMHGGEMHILFNMLGLWMFGSAVENMIGQKKFLILYFVSGLGAVFFSQAIDYIQFNSIYNELTKIGVSKQEIMQIIQTNEVSNVILENISKGKLITLMTIYFKSLVGASGALYGVMVAFGVLQPRAKMGLLFLPIMIEARYFIPLLLLGDIFFGIFGTTNIGHFAHVGGAIAGFLLILKLKKHTFTRWN